MNNEQPRINLDFNFLLICLTCLVVGFGCTTYRYVAWRVSTDPPGAYVSDKATGQYFGETPTEIMFDQVKIKPPLIGSAKAVEAIKLFKIEKQGYHAREEERLTLTYQYKTEEEAKKYVRELKVLLHQLPSAPRSSLIKFHVTSSPSAAAIFIDGIFRGETSATIEVNWPPNRGKIELRLEKDRLSASRTSATSGRYKNAHCASADSIEATYSQSYRIRNEMCRTKLSR